MKKRYLIPAVCVASLVGLVAMGTSEDKGQLNACNAGNSDQCYLVDIESNKAAITNKEWLDEQAAIAKAAADKEAKQKAANKKWRAEQKARDAKRAEAKRQADAKFKAEGWWEKQPGIYVRWCTQTCNNSKVIGNNRYSLLEVWAKDRAAGDIYARVNLIRDGVVIGWTNDTAYLSKGQRGVLTFDSYQFFDEAQLTEFNARG